MGVSAGARAERADGREERTHRAGKEDERGAPLAGAGAERAGAVALLRLASAHGETGAIGGVVGLGDGGHPGGQPGAEVGEGGALGESKGEPAVHGDRLTGGVEGEGRQHHARRHEKRVHHRERQRVHPGQRDDGEIDAQPGEGLPARSHGARLPGRLEQAHGRPALAGVPVAGQLRLERLVTGELESVVVADPRRRRRGRRRDLRGQRLSFAASFAVSLPGHSGGSSPRGGSLVGETDARRQRRHAEEEADEAEHRPPPSTPARSPRHARSPRSRAPLPPPRAPGALPAARPDRRCAARAPRAAG